MTRKRSFAFRAEGNKVLVKALHSGEEYLMCTVDKTDRHAWAQFIASRMELVEEFRVSGMTFDELRGVMRLYAATKEDTTN